jgi:hypothetical protein
MEFPGQSAPAPRISGLIQLSAAAADALARIFHWIFSSMFVGMSQPRLARENTKKEK